MFGWWLWWWNISCIFFCCEFKHAPRSHLIPLSWLNRSFIVWVLFRALWYSILILLIYYVFEIRVLFHIPATTDWKKRGEEHPLIASGKKIAFMCSLYTEQRIYSNSILKRKNGGSRKKRAQRTERKKFKCLPRKWEWMEYVHFSIENMSIRPYFLHRKNNAYRNEDPKAVVYA